MKRCFIFSAGTFYGLRERPCAGDLVIAADAGYRTCLRLGITPDLVEGDFDSMEEPEEFPHVLRVPVEKDDTDTMLAAKIGAERGCGAFYLYGATGGSRLDHTLANFQTLLWLKKRGAECVLYDREFAFTALCGGTVEIPRQVERGIVSVLCLGETARGVTERGLQYPLENAVLTPGFPLGVSNHILAERASVQADSGDLIVGWQLPPLA
ncbi:MAG: thiamine diphosphokinase [Oscillibacter sp.]|jgi:thiamine pyrophosphokinase|nr:thiamine diphosphokinase [Oscillibacter sp.]